MNITENPEEETFGYLRHVSISADPVEAVLQQFDLAVPQNGEGQLLKNGAKQLVSAARPIFVAMYSNTFES